MYISVITLPVRDLERAINFYTKTLGWEKTMDAPMGEGDRWVTVAPQGGQASFTLSVVDATATPNENDIRVILEVENVYSTCNDLQAKGVTVTQQPSTEPWGGWAMIKDSEGNVHGLHSPATVGASSN